MVATRRQPLRIESTAHRTVVVKLRPQFVRAARGVGRGGGAMALASAAGARDEQPLDRLLTRFDVQAIEPVFPGSSVRRMSTHDRLALTVTDEPEDELAGLNIVRLGSEQDAVTACAAMEEDDRVEYCHVVPERYLLGARRAPSTRRRRRGGLDPLLNRQWGLTAVQLAQAQQAAGFREATDVTIAVIDSGVDAGHPDLQGVVVDEQNFTTVARRDTQGHGTHVIGIIAALRNNRLGISGVCQSRRVMSLKALGPYNAAGYYRAIRYATDNGARVISLSLGGSHDPTEELLLTRAIARRVVVVAAMGNEFEEGNPTSYPAAIRDVIAVGASTEVDRRARFSCTVLRAEIDERTRQPPAAFLDEALVSLRHIVGRGFREQDGESHDCENQARGAPEASGEGTASVPHRQR